MGKTTPKDYEKRPATEWQKSVSKARKMFPRESFPAIQQRAKNSYYGIISLEEQKKKKTRILPSHSDQEREKKGEYDDEKPKRKRGKKPGSKYVSKLQARRR